MAYGFNEDKSKADFKDIIKIKTSRVSDMTFRANTVDTRTWGTGINADEHIIIGVLSIRALINNVSPNDKLLLSHGFYVTTVWDKYAISAWWENPTNADIVATIEVEVAYI